MIKYSVSKQITGIKRGTLKVETLNNSIFATERNVIIFKHCKLYIGAEKKIR